MVIKETLELIFVNYWSQIVLMGGGFLYIFKNYFERRSKLIELKSSILIQNNIDQLNILNKKYCEISMHLEEILISKYESSKQDEVTDNDTIKPDSIKSNFRSEERRVGKESKFRWAMSNEKKRNRNNVG